MHAKRSSIGKDGEGQQWRSQQGNVVGKCLKVLAGKHRTGPLKPEAQAKPIFTLSLKYAICDTGKYPLPD